jgi:hypothetical protein
MPEWFERQLEKEARKKHLKGKHKDAYIYGTMRRVGWKPKKRIKEVKRGSKHRRRNL